VQKYDNYIHEFLLQEKEISLERIGTLKLPENNEIEFVADRKALTSPAFISYVGEKLGKNTVLMSNNIESYLEQARQFINLGKPYVIPGLGNIYITKTGQYAFEPHFSSDTQAEDMTDNYQHLTEPLEKERKKKGVMGLAAALVIIIVVAAGYGIYKYWKNNKTTEPVASENTTTPTEDTLVNNNDTVSLKPDSIPTTTATTPLQPGEEASFKFIIEQTHNVRRAYNRNAQLIALKIPIHLDSIKGADSTMYRLYFIKTARTEDIPHIKDSLMNWYTAKRVIVERN
jgi:hypothetical protein